jgi:hypothetical protein
MLAESALGLSPCALLPLHAVMNNAQGIISANNSIFILL